MSRALKEWIDRKRGEARGDEPRPLSREERLALHRLRTEARAVGSDLQNRGRGGLSPSLVLTVFRRDSYTCKACGRLGSMKVNGGLTLHHKGGIVESEWLSKKGHRNEPNNLVAVCGACHDRMHEEARAEGVDSSQVEPEGDR
jgi:hypothetical protein